MLLLRVKRVNRESLEEMGCLAKMEYQDYQESRCVSLCASVCVPVVDCVCGVHCADFIRSSSSLCNLILRALLDLQARPV